MPVSRDTLAEKHVTKILKYFTISATPCIWNTCNCMFLILHCENPMCTVFRYFPVFIWDVVTCDNTRLDVLPAMTLTVEVFWYATSCMSLGVLQHVEVQCLHCQSEAVQHTRSFRLSSSARWHSITSQKTNLNFQVRWKGMKIKETLGPKFIR
jgi:hypothetical protein